MSTVQLFDVEFRVYKAAAAALPAGQGGLGYAYQRIGLRKSTVAAASGHPKDILAVLNADITVLAGETIDIIAVAPHPGVGGTEGGAILS